MQPPKKTYTLQEATKKLEHYCAYQERSHQEVRQKLEGMNMIPEAIDVIIIHLLEHNFLNEERFAKAYVSGKFKMKNWGKSRLTYELKRKDVSKVNIITAIDEISDEQYIEVFNSLAKKKVDAIKETDKWKKKRKFVDYFLRLGWESYLVYDKANELIK
ncbi:recombination regulator RecX [Flavobacteriaceae bacterium XHP0103]|uniref:regulatory protein RecX n=1 Tax=Marixanthotalea marina TaxID=2844359 RepID=UPI002989BBFB|nr:regulatory protein RecX [Marixanthotalea marina]MBU3820790.1 recombination regulator RecX [Marixanthotalea marina]